MEEKIRNGELTEQDIEEAGPKMNRNALLQVNGGSNLEEKTSSLKDQGAIIRLGDEGIDSAGESLDSQTASDPAEQK